MDDQSATIATLTEANRLRTMLLEEIIRRQQVVPEGAARCWEMGECQRIMAEHHGPGGLRWFERLSAAQQALTNYQGGLDWLDAYDVMRGLKQPGPSRYEPSVWPNGSAGD